MEISPAFAPLRIFAAADAFIGAAEKRIAALAVRAVCFFDVEPETQRHSSKGDVSCWPT